MPYRNKVFILGHLGRDPELKYTKQGTSICEFSVATSHSWKKDDEWQKETEWHKITAWGDLADKCNDRLRKGNIADIEGRIKTDEWQDKDGNKRYTTKIVAEKILFFDKNEKVSQGGGEEAKGSDGQTNFGDDDIPF